MILVRGIIHPAKPYMYSLLLENEPTSSNSHLIRNEKWKLWVGWHSSSCWLLCLCVLCFVFCAASKTIWCSWVSLYYLIFQKMKIMSDHYYYRRKKRSSRLSGRCAIGARSLLRPEKKVLVICLAGARSLIRPEKKVLVVCLAGAQSLLRSENKKDTVVCLAGARSLLWPEKKF